MTGDELAALGAAGLALWASATATDGIAGRLHAGGGPAAASEAARLYQVILMAKRAVAMLEDQHLALQEEAGQAPGHNPHAVLHLPSYVLSDRAAAEARAYTDRGFTVAPLPADGRDHTVGGACPACTADATAAAVAEATAAVGALLAAEAAARDTDPVVISANTAMAAAETIRRGHAGPGHDDGDACAYLASLLTERPGIPR